MSYKLTTSLLFTSLISSIPSFASELEPLVVTATRTALPLNQVASSTTVISAEDIKLKQLQTLTDALQSIAGIQIVQSGVKGSQTSVFMRGSNSNHTLVLVDGIEINDPSSPNGAFDFAHFPLHNVKQIEIVKGAQSVLYGADAIGGVIHIRTNRGTSDSNVSGQFEIGTRNSQRQAFTVFGANELAHYSASINYLDTDGDSIAAVDSSGVSVSEDDDGYRNKGFSLNAGLTPSPLFETNIALRYIDSDNDIDGFQADDVNARNHQRQLFINTELKGFLFNRQWQPTLSYSQSNIDRQNKDDRLAITENLVRTFFDAKKEKFSFQNDFYFIPQNTISIGYEIENERINNRGFTSFGDTSGFGNFVINEQTNADRKTRSFFIQDQIAITEQLNLTLGARYDDPDDFDSERTYRANVLYTINEQTQLRFNYGTAFKAPSLFELSGSSSNTFAGFPSGVYLGNPNLDPETSKTWEIGFNHLFWNDSVDFSFTYFDSNIEDLIETVFIFPDSTTINQDEVDIYGTETHLGLVINDSLAFGLSHTFTRTKDDNDQSLVRRPLHKANLDMHYAIGPKLDIQANLLHIGSRKDIDAVGNRIRTSSYTTINVAANYQLNNNIRLFSRIDNLADRDYQPAFGFKAPGITGYVGIALNY